MLTNRRIILCVVLIGLTVCPLCLAAEPSVDIELVIEQGFPLEGRQSWFKAMQVVPNVNLRIVSAAGGERESVEDVGTPQTPRYRVVGILTQRNRLRLPGSEFSLSDRTQIVQWFERLRTEGIAEPKENRAAFGLTSAQLVRFHDLLALPIDFPTKDQRAGDVARRIVRQLGIPFDVTPEATKAFGLNETMPDELLGLSAGTALAAVLRPLGLGAAPRKARTGELQLLIAEFTQLEEFWPVGWPSEESPFQIAPTLFQRLNVEISETPLAEALAAIQGRVEVPFLLDQNALARMRIDLKEAKASYPKGSASYKKILDQILFQNHLISELRVDEAGQPFVWITSAKR